MGQKVVGGVGVVLAALLWLGTGAARGDDSQPTSVDRLVPGHNVQVRNLSHGFEFGVTNRGEGKLTTDNKFQTPLVITLRAKTDSTNIRLYYDRGMIIFNWEENQQQLRHHDPATGQRTGVDGEGSVPINTWVTIRWTITDHRSIIEVNGRQRAAFDGNYAGLSSTVSIGTNAGAIVTVADLTILRAKHGDDGGSDKAEPQKPDESNAPDDQQPDDDVPALHADRDMDSTPMSGPTVRVTKPVTSIQSLEVYTTNTGMMLGQTSQVVLTVDRGDVSKLTSIRFVTPVGDQMRLARDEALRYIRVTYPNWYADKAEISFEDKYNGHEGGSIGAALGTLMMSAIQGFDIDSKLAMTGDISANGRVRAIGGVSAKLRGAAASHCALVAMPMDNQDQVVDTVVYSGMDAVTDVQVIGIDSLDDAVALARVDRAANLSAAIVDFAQIQQSIKDSPGYLHTQDAQNRLAEVLRLAPRHLSAKVLMMIARDRLPKTLSASASMYYTFLAVKGMLPVLRERAQTGATDVPLETVTAGLASLKKLRPIADDSVCPLIDAWYRFIWSINMYQKGNIDHDTLLERAQAVDDAMAKLQADEKLMQKMLKEGM